LDSVILEAKRRATRLEEPDELWEMEHWLTRRRQEIDSKYDFRYSVLPLVFAKLLRDGRISEGELNGLGEDKLGDLPSSAIPREFDDSMEEHMSRADWTHSAAYEHRT
jgi:hypothetical protein